MSNPYFTFKQFTIRHDRCAMKVGTDGVLLGAWAEVSSSRRILDVGTGTGLIALMLAQRSNALIWAIDIDADAVKQARENVAASPWKDRIVVEWQDVRTYEPGVCFDLVISNPPYFTRSLKSVNEARNTAKHTEKLDFENLITAAERLIVPEGTLSIILPSDGMAAFRKTAECHGFNLSRCMWVCTKPKADPKRVLLSFKRFPTDISIEELTLELSYHVYSKEYIALTQDFYLHISSEP